MLKHFPSEMSYALKIDLIKDDKITIMKKIDEVISKLDHNTNCLFHLSTTLYNIRKFGDRVNRYKDTLSDTNLSMEDCTHIAQYCKESVLSFLQTPLNDFKNIYLYDSTTSRWIVVSPTGYLWLIYGNNARKIKLIGKYLYSLITNDTSLIDLKNASTFTTKCISALFTTSEDENTLSNLLLNTEFISIYQKLTSMIEIGTMKNNITPIV